MISEETRKKLRDSHLGKPGWWAGKKRPDISRMMKGKKRSSETIKKVADSMRGKKRKPHSQETKDKISKRLMGNKNTFGKKYSPEVGEKHRQRMLGTHPSKEVLEKLSKIRKGKPGAWLGKIRVDMLGEKHPNWKGGELLNRGKYRKDRRERKLLGGGCHTKKEWEELKKLHNYTCLCCKKQEPEVKLTKDHVIPLKMGGSSFIQNIQPLCKYCNSRKHATDKDYRNI